MIKYEIKSIIEWLRICQDVSVFFDFRGLEIWTFEN